SGDEGPVAPPSPQDSCLKRRRRRVTLSAMSAEISALEEAAQEGVPGISQKDLDSLAVAEEGGALRSSSPIGSGLRKAKRSRLSVGDGPAGAAAKAAELFGTESMAPFTPPARTSGLSQQESIAPRTPTKNGGLSQQELDDLSSSCQAQTAPASRSPQSPAVRSRRCSRLTVQADENSCNQLDENTSPSKPNKNCCAKMAPGSPMSPCRSSQRPRQLPLSPVRLN
ncbi:unnamed protein product, partial [Polarella glacialis]